MKNKVVIYGTFNRKPLGAINEKNSVPIGWFALPFRMMPDIKDRRKFHGRWFLIECGNIKIYRVLRFAGNLKGTVRNDDTKEILLDWIGWIDLCNRDEEVDVELKLKISPISFWKYISAGLHHPEPSFKLSVILACISLFLGLLSVLLAIVVFIK